MLFVTVDHCLEEDTITVPWLRNVYNTRAVDSNGRGPVDVGVMKFYRLQGYVGTYIDYLSD